MLCTPEEGLVFPVSGEQGTDSQLFHCIYLDNQYKIRVPHLAYFQTGQVLQMVIMIIE